MEVSVSNEFLKKASKVLETNEYFITCYECKKYYVVPTIAPCGHSLCYTCWIGRKSCAHCEKKVDKKSLRLNLVLQNLTKHIHNLQDTSKDIVGPRTKKNRFMSDIESNNLHEEENVNEWLINSQNHFSECVMEESISEIIKPTINIVNDIQVDEKKNKIKSRLVDQSDWDNIEELPNSEDMDIEPYKDLEMVEEGNKYLMDYPRRSSRNKNIYLEKNKQVTDSLNKSKNNNKNNTIKNMNKEFNKVNKKITNKLNDSVEKPKNIKNCKNYLLENCKVINVDKVDSSNEIKESNKDNSGGIKDSLNEENNYDTDENVQNHFLYEKNVLTRKNNGISNILASNNNQQVGKKTLKPPGTQIKNVTFLKMSSLNSQTEQSEYFKKILDETVNTDEVEINIKVGNTVTSICINKNENDTKVSSKKFENIHNKIHLSILPLQKVTQKELANKSVQVSLIENSSQLKEDTEIKKNTASTDTSTLNTQTKKIFERQLRPVKENEEMEDTNKSLSNANMAKVSKLIDNPEDDELLNDVYNMFDNESVKEHNVHSLSQLVHTPSPIFLPSNISKSQNKKKKMERDDSEFEAPSKKCRITESISQKNKLTTQKLFNKSDKYDEFMSQVSANIENLKVHKENMEGDILQKIIPATTSQKSGQSQIKNFDPNKPVEQKHSENIWMDNLQHTSTPLAKKSLNFNEADQIICPFVAANTQEKEIMDRAFEDTTKTEISRNNQYCLVTSCLSSLEYDKVKLLCAQKNLTFVNKFTNNVTHLIVKVSENNISVRSVKFVSALAASKWIVSMEWIEKCLNSKDIVNEEPYEVLDVSGQPAPRRSRLARKKLFSGIKFYCMPPFSLLNIDNLKEILLSAGGELVDDINQIEAMESPSILLADPEDTQDDQFIHLAVRRSVVPVNLEWIIESLCCYTLASIGNHLLCPSSLLPPCTTKWPFVLNLSQDSIDD